MGELQRDSDYAEVGAAVAIDIAVLKLDEGIPKNAITEVFVDDVAQVALLPRFPPRLHISRWI